MDGRGNNYVHDLYKAYHKGAEKTRLESITEMLQDSRNDNHNLRNNCLVLKFSKPKTINPSKISFRYVAIAVEL
jgi:hypothetical protein